LIFSSYYARIGGKDTGGLMSEDLRVLRAARPAQQQAERAAARPPGRRSAAWPLALTCAAGFIVALDALVVATALPVMQRGLHASVTTLGWTISAYALTFGAGIAAAAAAGDRYGRRRVFTAGLLVFTAASAACGLAPTAGTLIAARAVQGLGAAAVSPLSLTILAGAVPAGRRGAAVGIWGGTAGLAVASGPLLGGTLAQGPGWHWIFWVNVPVGIALAVLATARLTDSRGPAARLDLPGAALVSAAATGLLWGLTRAGQAGWTARPTLAALGLGAAALAGFLAWEARAAHPMLPPRLLRSRPFAAAAASGFLMMASLIPAAFLISQYLQAGLGYGPLAAGLRFLPMTATPLLVAPAAGKLSDRIGQRPVMITGLALQAAGLAWLALAGTTGGGYSRLVPPLLLAGIGVSMPFATTATAALAAAGPADIGKASGAANTLRQFGAAAGIAVTTAVFTAAGHLGGPAAFDAGFRPAMATAAAIAATGAITARGVARRAPTAPAIPASGEDGQAGPARPCRHRLAAGHPQPSEDQKGQRP
jgi:EmrB/QacA subfamily drug resistance transporter